MKHLPKLARWIVSAVARLYDITTDQIMAHDRSLRVAEARHVTAYMLYDAGYSTVAVGRLLRRDHSTVLHSLRRVQESDAMRSVAETLLNRLPIKLRSAGAQGVSLPQDIGRVTARLPESDALAVRAHIHTDLLGKPTRSTSLQRLHGLRVLMSNRDVLEGVANSLKRYGEPGAAHLIGVHGARLGYTVRKGVTS